MRDPWAVATWRFEQLSPLLEPSLSRAEKRRYVREKAAQAVPWPSSESERAPRRPIGRATLCRWLRLYQTGGLSALVPKPPARQKPDRSHLVAYALALLVEEPERSFTQLLVYLELEFPDAELSRATLQRELTQHPAYAGIVKDRCGTTRKLRDRYETAYPHQSWQLDGKGPFQVTIAGVSHRRVHVLSIIDDYSRYILASVVSRGEDTAATVRVIRLALDTYGLPERMQFDRGSAFDSLDFRRGLALLGIHRNWVQARAAEALCPPHGYVYFVELLSPSPNELNSVSFPVSLPLALASGGEEAGDADGYRAEAMSVLQALVQGRPPAEGPPVRLLETGVPSQTPRG